MSHDTTTPNGEELPTETIREIVREEIDRTVEDTTNRYSRRDVLKGAALLGGAAATASLGTLAAVGQAAAQQQGSGTIGTQDNPLEAIYVDNLYQNTDNIVADSITTDELNRTYQLDPDEDDFGAALSAILPDLSMGDIVEVPPVEYPNSTKVELTEPIGLIGQSFGGRNPNTDLPKIGKAEDDWLIDCVQGCGIFARGLYFDGAGISDTTGGIRTTAYSQVEDCHFADLGGHGVYLEQSVSASNANVSEFIGVGGSGLSGAVVGVENTSADAPDVNGLNIEVTHSIDNDMAVYDRDGIGNTIEVVTTEGSSHSAVVQANTSSKVNLGYVESDVSIGVDFQGNNSVCFAHFNQATDKANFGNSDNWYWDFRADQGIDLESPSIVFKTGTPFRHVDCSAQFEDSNGDVCYLYAEGGELIAEDASGNTTTLT